MEKDSSIVGFRERGLFSVQQYFSIAEECPLVTGVFTKFQCGCGNLNLRTDAAFLTFFVYGYAYAYITGVQIDMYP
jgi:hypothetical protein